jgi:histidyl-tRNA synthetase
MADSIQPIRGMNDVLPDSSHVWQHVERVASDLFESYGYRQIRVPVLERTELFKRSIGEVTDIVEKEMYTFEDRSGDSVTLRPEATAGIVRAALSNSLLHNQQHRVWFAGPMFRYERPQKGRYRQFHQIDVEALGYAGPDVDAELIALSARLWRRLGLTGLRLEINSLGTPESRVGYREALVNYFKAHEGQLDADSQRRLVTNPMRILDSKNPAMASLVAGAPQITEYLDAESQQHFDRLQALLGAIGIPFTVNPRLVRGLDYYSRTVFEWLTDRLGAQAAVCSGGRYDGLVGQLGGKPTPAIGWALGLERIVELLTLEPAVPPPPEPHAYLVMAGDAAAREGFVLAERLRDALAAVDVELDCVGGSFKAQMRRADKRGARVALILGEQELSTGLISVKPLRAGAGEQRQLTFEALVEYLQPYCGQTR